MAGNVQLQILDGTNTFTFEFDGKVKVEKEHFYNEAANPPQLRTIQERWTCTGFFLTGATDAATFDRLDALLASTQDRTTTPPTHARIVRDPGGTPVVEQTLGSTGQEGFRIERVDYGEPEVDALEAGVWKSLIPVTIIMAAFREFPDGNGIIAWAQVIRNTYAHPSGLHSLEWETEITVAEGAASSALTLAETHAVIPIATIGSTYTWGTNSDKGFDWEELDADTRLTPDRTPTRLRVISRVQQWGIGVGTPTAGNSVGAVTLSTEVETEGNTTRTTTRATADGPGAFAWVTAQNPGGKQSRSRTLNGQATRHSEGMWVVESPASSKIRREIATVLSGGSQDIEYVVMSGVNRPQKVVGPLQVFRLEVTIRLEYVGDRPTLDQMKFPPELTTWELQPNLCREDPQPRLTRAGSDQGGDTWERNAFLVYVSAEEPPETSLEILFDEDQGQPTYLLGRS